MRTFCGSKIICVLAVVGCLLTAIGWTAEGRNAPVNPSGPVRVVVIDPGHGGYDSGAIGPEGTAEKTVTLTLARLAAAKLTPRYRVLLTRSGDYRVDLADRVATANHQQADLYLSLHAGGGFSMKGGGMNIYIDNTVPPPNRNPPDFTITDLSVGRAAVAWDEAQSAHHRLAKAFADVMAQTGRQVLNGQWRVTSDRMAVLQGADMPAVMIEIGSLANPSWERQLRDPDRLKVLADMICLAIDRFFLSDQSVAGNNRE